MGWDFRHGASKADVIKELTKPWERDGRTHRAIARAVRGNVLWTVNEHTDKTSGAATREIGCCLLRKERAYGWGYKGMCESMGPYYYTCPLLYLDMVPVANQDWRDEVRRQHMAREDQAATAKTLTVGACISLVGATIPEVTIVGKRKRTWIGEYAGRQYRIPVSMIGERLPYKRVM